MMERDQIKKVDYLDFISKDSHKRQQFIQDFGDSFSNMGFAIVANHGVSANLKKKLYDTIQTFFALPVDVKRSYENDAIHGQRGYTSKNKESAKGEAVPDLKEFFHIGQEQSENNEFNYPLNIWDDNIPELKEYGLSVFKTLEQTGSNLLQAIALYLELPKNYFQDKIENGNSILRLLHYYPLLDAEQHDPSAVRAAAHGDINLITLLMGASADGLQAQTLDGEWIDVIPNEDEIVINVGDMLERLTNNKLRSTIHRVVNPTDPEKLKTSRYSTPFFLHPHPNMNLACLPSCVTNENPKQYPDITAGAFLSERLIELGLKK